MHKENKDIIRPFIFFAHFTPIFKTIGVKYDKDIFLTCFVTFIYAALQISGDISQSEIKFTSQ